MLSLCPLSFSFFLFSAVPFVIILNNRLPVFPALFMFITAVVLFFPCSWSRSGDNRDHLNDLVTLISSWSGTEHTDREGDRCRTVSFFIYLTSAVTNKVRLTDYSGLSPPTVTVTSWVWRRSSWGDAAAQSRELRRGMRTKQSFFWSSLAWQQSETFSLKVSQSLTETVTCKNLFVFFLMMNQRQPQSRTLCLLRFLILEVWSNI